MTALNVLTVKTMIALLVCLPFLGPEFYGFPSKYVALAAEKEPPAIKTKNDLITRAIAFYNRHKSEEALKAFQTAESTYPQDPIVA